MASDIGRVLRADTKLHFGLGGTAANSVAPTTFWGDGVPHVSEGRLIVRFGGQGLVHKLVIQVCAPFTGTGLSVRLRTSGWSTLRSLIVGYEHAGKLRKLNIKNLWQDQWVDVAVCHADLAYRIQNDWEELDRAEIAKIHLHFHGQTDADGACLELESIELWDEDESDFRLEVADRSTTLAALLTSPGLASHFGAMPQGLLDIVEAHLEHFFPDANEQAEELMQFGFAPSHRTSLPWPHDVRVPPGVARVNTYRWSWHALHPVIVLLAYARRTGELAPVFAARDFASSWLDTSYFQVDEDAKYCWYDQGVGDRLIALAMLWDAGVRLRFDRRFMHRLLTAIFRHGQLLASEAFYAANQGTRYHNHAVLQDLALMYGAAALPEISCSRQWFELAARRVTDQIERLLRREADMAVLIENSVSYHVGFQTIVNLAARLTDIAQIPCAISDIAQGMQRFGELARYPDGRVPGLGDSPRTANRLHPSAAGREPYKKPALVLLPGVGHAFVKGNHQQRPFMLAVQATSIGATHKHQDNLSFTLFFDGIEWLIDPSFYSYEPTQQLSNYLRSAWAHNALVLAQGEYSIAPGLARLSGSSEAAAWVVSGEHDAYATARIERRFEGRLDDLKLSIEDRVRPHDATFDTPTYLMLHCGDGVEAQIQGRALTLSHPASEYVLRVHLPEAACRLWHGEKQDETLRGFTGLGFMEQAAITSIECRLGSQREARWEIVAERQAPTALG